MKNFREIQVNSTDEYCMNQYWEKDINVNNINITVYYWKRKEGCKGFDGTENISKVIGFKDDKWRMVKGIWDLNLGEKHCVNLIVSKYKCL